MHSVFRGLEELPAAQDEEKLRRLRTLRLRYFTPREIATLMGFPSNLGESGSGKVTSQHPLVRLF